MSNPFSVRYQSTNSLIFSSDISLFYLRSNARVNDYSKISNIIFGNFNLNDSPITHSDFFLRTNGTYLFLNYNTVRLQKTDRNGFTIYIVSAPVTFTRLVWLVDSVKSLIDCISSLYYEALKNNNFDLRIISRTAWCGWPGSFL